MHGIFETIEQYHMIAPGMHVIAGISGGADSVCLLYVLCEYRKRVPFELTAVHVEHGLRGEESLADAAFTQELCARFDVPCHVVHIQADRLARAEGISTEEAGRRERYRIFCGICEKISAQRIAVAHNQNDQAETVLWNLARGSGLKGLCGMNPVRGNIIRPLLFTDRVRIEQILTEAGLTWRTDQTNLQQDYTRNRIRLSVLPQMEEELNGRAVEHIADAAGRLRQVQEYLDRVTDQAAGSCIYGEPGSVCLRLPQWKEQDPLICQELLKRAAEKCGGLRDFGHVHLEALEALCAMDCGKELSLPGHIRAVRERTIVRFTRENDRGAGKGSGKGSGGMDAYSACPDFRDEKTFAQKSGVTEGSAQRAFPVPVPGTFCADRWRVRTELCANSPELMKQIIVEKKYTKWLSYDTINNNILQFRTRRPGDYLIISREGGRKKLKDYLIDLKIPRAQRDHIWLLADGSHVLWVTGYRISEAAKVTENTDKIIKIQVEEEQDEREDTDITDRAGSE